MTVSTNAPTQTDPAIPSGPPKSLTETINALPLHTSSVRSVLALVRRNLVGIVRVPSAALPSLIFPIFGTIAFASLYGAAIRQYFPSLNSLNWYAPVNVMQGAAFGGVFLAFATIRDFQTGVVDRLLVSPMRRRSMLIAAELTAMARAVLPFVLVLLIGMVGGMSLPGGVLGLVSLLIASVAISAIGCMWGLGLAYRFKTMAAAPLMQVGVFVLVFLSATQVPMRGLSGWLHTIARVNPATNLLRLGRQGFLGHVTWHDTWPGLLSAAGFGVVAWIFAERGLRRL